MRVVRVIVARLRGLFRRDVVAGEIHDELHFHLRERTEQYEREGLAPDDAARKARKRVGSLPLYQDEGYDVRGGGWLETFAQDVRYSFRTLRRQRGFTAVAVLTLALGMGASTALFSVVDAALLRPLPHPNPEQLVEVVAEDIDSDGEVSWLGPALADARSWRENSQSLSHVTVWRSGGREVVQGEPAERVRVREISEGYLGVFGAAPHLGRDIQMDDTREGAEPVVLLGYAYWQRSFVGSADVLSERLRLSEGTATIVGVLPQDFFPTVDIWRPLQLGRFEEMRGSGATAYGRLRPGVGLDQAGRELTQLSQRGTVARRQGYADDTMQVWSLYDVTTSRYRTTVRVAVGAVGLILLIACINVAGLLLARGTGRHGELAVRAAIGAGRARLVRQLLTESVVLAAAGGVAGIVTAWGALDVIVSLMPMTLPADAPVRLHGGVLAASAGASVAIGLAFGLAPAFTLSRVSLNTMLASGSRRPGVGLSMRSGQVLIATEVALAVVLVSGAGLMLRSFDRLMSVDLGFDPSRIVTLDVVPVDPAAAALYYPALLDRVRRLPDVQAAGAINHMPIVGPQLHTSARIDGASIGVQTRIVLPGYFEAMGLPLLAGRFLSDADRAAGRPVVVVNEAGARRLSPTGTLLGRTLEIARRHYDVIGTVGNVRHAGPEREPTPVEVYLPFDETFAGSMTVVTWPTDRATGLAERLTQAAEGVGPRVLVDRVASGRTLLAERVTTPRRRTALLSMLGGLGLLLALVGLFGVTAYAVARRTQEIGVRMAFGARPGQVVAAIVRDSTVPAAVGIAVGLGGALLSSRLIERFLFETAPTDPMTYVAVSVGLGAATFAAAWIAGRRAAHVDPLATLRAE